MSKANMDRMPASPDVNQERLEQLRAHMPDPFTNDGALQDVQNARWLPGIDCKETGHTRLVSPHPRDCPGGFRKGES